MELRDLYPAKMDFPGAVADVATVPGDVTILRLVSKVQNAALLPQLTRLEALWCFDLNAVSAPIVGSLTTLRRLYVEGVRLPTFEAFTQLDGLDVLSLERCTKIASLDELAPFERVRGLGIIHFPRVQSLLPLERFASLRALIVAGGMWTRMNVETLAPLSRLTRLEHLALTNLKAADGSLQPLAELASLKTLELPNFYSMEEFARLSARLPNTSCVWFASFQPFRAVACPKCGQASMVMLTGKGAPTLCTACDEVPVRRHDERFRTIAAE